MPGIALALVLSTFAVYASTAGFGFVTLDDPTYVTKNPHVLQGLTGAGIAWAFTTTWASNYHPLTWIAHMLVVSLFGVTGGAHHVVNVLLHAANTVLLFVVLLRMTGATARSAIVAALFALHPAHVESVAWIAELKDVLSTLFWMLTMLAYERYVRHPERKRFFTVIAFYALGLLTKPMLVTLPFVLLLLDVWPLQRFSKTTSGGRLLALVTEKAPLFALSALSCVITFVAQHRGGAVSALDVLPWTSRLMNAVLACEAYLRRLVWPSDLAVFYPYPRGVGALEVAGATLLIAAITAAAVLLRRTRPYLAVGWLWFLGTLIPVIGLVQVGGQATADRYTYIPFIGLFIAIVWTVADLVPRTALARRVLATATGVALAASAIVAREQVSYWQDGHTLWSRALDVTNDNHRAYAALGQILVADGRTAEAIAHYSEAIRLAPTTAQYHNFLGLARLQDGDHAAAMREFETALKLKPASADVRANMGLVLSRMGRLEEAARAYDDALRLQPDLADAHLGLGLVYALQGRVEEARAHLEAVLRLNPANQDARRALNTLTAR